MSMGKNSRNFHHLHKDHMKIDHQLWGDWLWDVGKYIMHLIRSSCTKISPFGVLYTLMTLLNLLY